MYSKDQSLQIPDVLSKYYSYFDALETVSFIGYVEQVIGFIIYSKGPEVKIGEICKIELSEDKNDSILSRVVGIHKDCIMLTPFGDINGIAYGMKVIKVGKELRIPFSNDLLGRVIDSLGNPIDGKSALSPFSYLDLKKEIPPAMKRPLIKDIFTTGIKMIDGLLTVGCGQRIGIFSGSGVGKSTLLGMLARYTESDINVIALIGERGREVREFLDSELGEKGLKKSVVIVETSDKAPICRIQAADTATAIAEYFREQGKKVLLLMDSLTRFALAQREVSLLLGEPAATKGYTPSVFSKIPQLLERTGTSENGTITAFYTVLIEGDDIHDPIADVARGTLDGHIFLSRKLAGQGLYPAIDLHQSLSRLMNKIIHEEHWEVTMKLRELIVTYYEHEELILVGAVTAGVSRKLDVAMRLIDSIRLFISQRIVESFTFEETLAHLSKLMRVPTIPVKKNIEEKLISNSDRS